MRSASLRAAHDRVLGVTQPGLMDIWRCQPARLARCRGGICFATARCRRTSRRCRRRRSGRASGRSACSCARSTEALVAAAADGRVDPRAGRGERHARRRDRGLLAAATRCCCGSSTCSSAPDAAAPAADELLAFGAHYANFKLVMWIYFLARRFLWADAGAPLDGGGRAERLLHHRAGRTCATSRAEQRAAGSVSSRTSSCRSRRAGRTVALRDHAFAIATAMGRRGATFATLEAIFASVIADVEAGSAARRRSRPRCSTASFPGATRSYAAPNAPRG